MRNVPAFAILVLTAACGLSVDTRVADTPATRLELMRSVIIGQTTPGQLVSRWGHPFQKIREGGRVGYVYRAAGAGEPDFVIVEFEYNLAINVRSTETERCRAEFSPRFPGYDWGTPKPVNVIGACGSATSGAIPGVTPDRYVPEPGSVK